MQYRFGPFTADRGGYQLRRGDQPLPVTPKLLDLLFHLLERPETLVTKEELLDAVWPGANVTDNALAQAMSELREALGDSPASPTYIRTVARRGYRFVAPVEAVARSRPVAAGRPAEAAGIAPAAPPASESTARTIAVLDFENLTGDAGLAWIAAGIAETVTNDLVALNCFHVVDRWRVASTTRVVGAAPAQVAAAVGASLVVSGSYQRQDARLRITARLIDVGRGVPLAEAKVDGALADVFLLQDEIVTAFARELGVRRTGGGHPPSRETSNLEAYRAYIEGWLKLEALDTDLVAAAVADFERAIDCDPHYAMAYTGLAHAQFVAYEMTRVFRTPDVDALAAGLAHARRAVQIDGQLAEAQATLSLLLAQSQAYDEARAAAQRAVSLEPDNWRHHFRLGHASWGAARQRALERALALFPQFPYAALELAFLCVARHQHDDATQIARQAALEQDRNARLGRRYPAIGFHWLLGALESAAERAELAIRHFDHELALGDRRTLYGPEYAAASLVGRGHAELALDQAARALESFRGARAHVDDHVPAWIGEAHALDRLARSSEARSAWSEVERATGLLARTDRQAEALHAEACRAALTGDERAAIKALHTMLDRLPVCQQGWSLSIEPGLRPVRDTPEFKSVIARLVERAS
jgi:DNA-binding winged helix-turn-helix (wHTH) protein/tetratricopeptide (TPR) repeat protein